MDDQITTTTTTTKPSVKPNGGGGVQQQQTSLLETIKSERHVWLMKCPPIVSRSLTHKQPQPQPIESPPPVGAKVIVTVDPLLPNNDFSSTQFTMELVGTESGRIPKCYSMDMSTDFIPMSVFSESKQASGKVSVEGKIYHKFDMKPHNDNMEEYGKLCRERTNKCMTKTRQIQVINNDCGAHMRPMPGLIPLKPLSQNEKKKAPVKGSDTKRTRRDRGEMEDIMFKLFERQPYWSLRNLIAETNQPEQFLKDLLKDLCIYNHRGSTQGSYELKPEYKRSTEVQEQGPSSK